MEAIFVSKVPGGNILSVLDNNENKETAEDKLKHRKICLYLNYVLGLFGNFIHRTRAMLKEREKKFGDIGSRSEKVAICNISDLPSIFIHPTILKVMTLMKFDFNLQTQKVTVNVIAKENSDFLHSSHARLNKYQRFYFAMSYLTLNPEREMDRVKYLTLVCARFFVFLKVFVVHFGMCFLLFNYFPN